MGRPADCGDAAGGEGLGKRSARKGEKGVLGWGRAARENGMGVWLATRLPKKTKWVFPCEYLIRYFSPKDQGKRVGYWSWKACFGIIGDRPAAGGAIECIYPIKERLSPGWEDCKKETFVANGGCRHEEKRKSPPSVNACPSRRACGDACACAVNACG